MAIDPKLPERTKGKSTVQIISEIKLETDRLIYQARSSVKGAMLLRDSQIDEFAPKVMSKEKYDKLKKLYHELDDVYGED